MKTLIYNVLTGRWFMLFASLLIMAAAGAAYMFGMYSNEVKTSLGYDQTTLNLLSFFKDVSATVGIIMNFFGYFIIFLAVTGRIAKPHAWKMCLYICIGLNSQTFTNMGGTNIFEEA